MARLIRADLFRLRKNTVFWILLCFCPVGGVSCALHALKWNYFDDPEIGILLLLTEAFLSLYIGREYSDGTIRSKIISGSTRRQIFLSRLCISFLVSSIAALLFLLPVIIICAKPVFSYIPVPLRFSMILGIFLANAGGAVIAAVASSLITARTAGSVASLLLGYAVMTAVFWFDGALAEPELTAIDATDSVLMTSEEEEQVKNGTFNIYDTCPYGGGWHDEIRDDGTVVYYKDFVVPGELFPNPDYIHEPFRTVVKQVYHILPFAFQREYCSYLYGWMEGFGEIDQEQAGREVAALPLYSAAFVLLLSGIGLYFFQKKEFQ